MAQLGDTPVLGAWQVGGPVPKGRTSHGALGRAGKPGGWRSLRLRSPPCQAQCLFPALSAGPLLAPQHPLAQATSQERRFSSFPFHRGDRGLQLPPALPPPQASLPAGSAPAPRKRAKAFPHSGVRESCRAEAAALRKAGGAPGLSRTERSGHGTDILFCCCCFFLFMKRLKQESTATNTKVEKGSGGVCPGTVRWKEATACARGWWAGIPPGIHKT